MRLEKNIILRVPMEMYNDYLIKVDNYSQYIRNLIDKDRLDRKDHKFIDSKIKEFEEKIKEFKELKKEKLQDKEKIKELLAYHAPSYKDNAMHRSENQRIRFLENSVFKDLKRLGYKGTSQDVDKLLLNWPEADQ